MDNTNVNFGRTPNKKARRRNLTMAILSLSLLTVMAGAAVAPALGVIQQHFAGESKALVQMVVSIPALFIALTTLVFPALARRFKARTLLLGALALYVIGGCAAGLANNIWVLLALRALVGVSVGVIMPLSTGLLSFYFTRDKQNRLMGYASAMNQMGGVIATLLSGLLATISWRASFLVYLLGLVCIVLCGLFLPNEYVVERNMANAGATDKAAARKDQPSGATTGKAAARKAQPAGAGKSPDAKAANPGMLANLRRYGLFVASMFFLMLSFFVYPSSFAMEIASEGVVPTVLVAPIMASMDLVAFFGGLTFAKACGVLGRNVRFEAPVLFAAGYALLFLGGWVGALFGSVLVGFANGCGVPFIMSSASKLAGRSAATTVMPLLSTALYAGQFVSPLVLAAASAALGDIVRMPYLVALVAAVCLGVCNAFVHVDAPSKDAVRQEQ